MAEVIGRFWIHPGGGAPEREALGRGATIEAAILNATGGAVVEWRGGILGGVGGWEVRAPGRDPLWIWRTFERLSEADGVAAVVEIVRSGPPDPVPPARPTRPAALTGTAAEIAAQRRVPSSLCPPPEGERFALLEIDPGPPPTEAVYGNFFRGLALAVRLAGHRPRSESPPRVAPQGRFGLLEID